ncbi:MAG: hypothetical protein ABI990_00290 [Actinomycetota bacterium]
MWDATMADEPISPELVLVDPELALRARMQVESYGPVIPVVQARVALPVAEPAQARHVGGPNWSAVAIGILVVVGVSFALSEWPPGVPRPVLSAAVPTSVSPSTPAPAASPRPSVFSPPSFVRNDAVLRSVSGTAAMQRRVELRVLQVLPARAGGLMLQVVIDRESGLVRDNVRVSCSAKHSPRAFACAVFSPAGKRLAVVPAQVRADGRISVGS